jgi:bacillithiol system protein YtxJ
MHWTHLTSAGQINDLLALSHDKAVVIFKHSTRCSLSSMVLHRIEKMRCMPDVNFYFLDILAQPLLSGRIAEMLHVHHESPQLLLLNSGECVYEESHSGITADDLLEQIREINPAIVSV